METAVNKSPKDTPTRSKKNNKDATKKKDENLKDEKQDVNTHISASGATSKETMRETKDTKEQSKETPVKEVKETFKEAPFLQPSNREVKKTKKKNDILAQIGKYFLLHLI